jgi:hypothetical protein
MLQWSVVSNRQNGINIFNSLTEHISDILCYELK